VSTVGFDPGQVRRLQRALDDALDDLDRLHRMCALVDAGPACRGALDEARRTVRDRWLPTTRRVLSCDALSGAVWTSSSGWTVRSSDSTATQVGAPDDLSARAAVWAHRWLDAAGRWQGGVDSSADSRAVRDQVAALARSVPVSSTSTMACASRCCRRSAARAR
jgi:hypothetical protein